MELEDLAPEMPVLEVGEVHVNDPDPAALAEVVVPVDSEGEEVVHVERPPPPIVATPRRSGRIRRGRLHFGF